MTPFYYTEGLCSAIAVLAVVSALLVISQAIQNPVNAVLWLIVAFVAVACYLITIGMTFLGLSYIIVYVGAIAVLFLFVVMMLNLAGDPSDTVNKSLAGKTWPVALVIVVAGALTLLPMASQLNLTVDLPLGYLNTLNAAFFGVDNFNSISTGLTYAGAGHTPVDTVSSMSQVQALGLTLYTHGALWLFILSVLLMLAMLVPLALAFTA